MTEPIDEPDWSLLPSHPREFFGLASGFEQKDLKRCYNRLIRRYKPEKFPAQFQQIRAAFESLDRLFTSPPYPGMSFQVVRVSAEELELSPIAAEENSRAMAHTNPTLLKRARSIPPDILHQQLRQTANRSEHEQLLLTFLEDARSSNSDLTFLDGLLAGARVTRTEESWELLRQYLRTAEARERCADILERIFFVLASDTVFPLTEPLWDELQQRVPFERFRQTMEDCVRHVTDQHIAPRLMFEIRLLRRTLFYATPGWTADRLARLTKGDVAWPEWLDHQIWSVEQLVAYTKVRQRFLNGNRLRTILDEVLQAYCLDSPEFDAAYLNLQSELLQHPDNVITAFPQRDRKVLPVIWNVWSFLSEQVGYRFSNHDSFNSQDSLKALSEHVHAWKPLSRPLLTSPRRWGPVAWGIILVAYLGFPLLLFLLTEAVNDRYLVLALSLLFAAMAHVALSFFAMPTELRFQFYSSRIRRELFAFVRRYPLPANLLWDRLNSRPTGSAQTDYLLAEAQHDFALRFYVLAAWTLR